MRIGVIGLGTIATAVVEVIARDGHAISVSKRTAQNAARLSAEYSAVTVAEPQAVVDASDIVLLGTTGPVARAVLPSLRFRPDQRIISLMADLDFAEVAVLVTPAVMAARMIPFPAIASGGSPVLAFGDRSLIDALFGGRNCVLAMETEAELGQYLCAQAVLSPAVSMVAIAAGWLGDRTADREKAEQFLRLLVGSSLQASACAPLLAALNTPGGYNRKLRQHMLDVGLGEDLIAGLNRLLD